METSNSPFSSVRFGKFEADLRTSELRLEGVKVKLQQQPFQVLAALLVRPGKLVSREEIRRLIWNNGTFVDFERGLNKAMNRLRDALGDAPGAPKFIETLPLTLAWRIPGCCWEFSDWFRPVRHSPKPGPRWIELCKLTTLSSKPHATLGHIRMTWDWSGAEQEFKRAIELNANYVIAHQWYGNLLVTAPYRDSATAADNRQCR
jgi:hypothetical protein